MGLMANKQIVVYFPSPRRFKLVSLFCGTWHTHSSQTHTHTHTRNQNSKHSSAKEKKGQKFETTWGSKWIIL